MAGTDEDFMALALGEAELAARRGDVPVGAVVVKAGKVIARAGNAREQAQDPTAHAEVLALRAAAASMGTWRLSGCTLYVTLEPCFMCAGALVNARVDRVVYAAKDPKGGAVESLAQVCSDPRLNHRLLAEGKVCEQASATMLREFFAGRRTRASSAALPPAEQRAGVKVEAPGDAKTGARGS